MIKKDNKGLFLSKPNNNHRNKGKWKKPNANQNNVNKFDNK